MRRLFALLCVLLALGMAVPALASPAAQTFDCNSVTGIPVTECQALVALYTSTNGPGWANHTDWVMTNMPWSGYGVTCVFGQVFVLNLNNNQLSGSIPSELGNLTDLYDLFLNNNQLSGDIPTSLVNLTFLNSDYNDLGYNRLTASDPTLLAFLAAKDPDWAATQTV